MKNIKYDIIIVGTGFAGSVLARKFAELGKNVLILERRPHIAGNMYDELDENGILVHKYGPHISYFSNWETYDFLSKYSEFVPYHHYVNSLIDGIEVPIPFNLNSIELLFDLKRAAFLKELLIKQFGMGSKIQILEMRKSKNNEIKELAEFIYQKAFLNYSTKIWGISPDNLDPVIIGRVPVHISYDDRHFTQPIQVMPKKGYTYLFKNILDHDNIKIELNVDALDRISVKDGAVKYLDEVFKGVLVYTGAIDELFNYKFGSLPYRSIFFKHETHKTDRLQSTTVLNWPDKRPAIRRTENKLLVCQPNVFGVTSTITEYAGDYDKTSKKWFEPYHPIVNKGNLVKYQRYVEESKRYSNLVLIGRLAEYKYYNMEGAILASLRKFEELTLKGYGNI